MAHFFYKRYHLFDGGFDIKAVKFIVVQAIILFKSFKITERSFRFDCLILKPKE